MIIFYGSIKKLYFEICARTQKKEVPVCFFIKDRCHKNFTEVLVHEKKIALAKSFRILKVVNTVDAFARISFW